MNTGSEKEVTDNDLPFIIRHSKIKEQLKSNTGSSPPPVPQTPRPVLKMTGTSQPRVNPQNLIASSPENPKPGMIKDGHSKPPIPQVAESEAGNRMTSGPSSLPVRQTPRPGTAIRESLPPAHHGSNADDGSVEHFYDQATDDEVVYDNIEDNNISSDVK